MQLAAIHGLLTTDNHKAKRIEQGVGGRVGDSDSGN